MSSPGAAVIRVSGARPATRQSTPERLARAAFLAAVLLDAGRDRPAVRLGRQVEVAGLVDRAHLEGVGHARLEHQVGLRADALGPELALGRLGHVGRLVRVGRLELRLLGRQRRVGRRVEAALERERGGRDRRLGRRCR